MENQEMSTDELIQKNMELQNQLERQVLINQKLQKEIGEKSNAIANVEITVDQLHSYAQSLEQRLQNQPKPNREAKRKADKNDA